MGPRNYFKADFYTKPDCNFYSEIGTVGCPNISSIKKFISPDKLWPWDNNEYYAHTTADSKTDNYTFYLTLLEDGIKENFDRVPDNLEDFVIASQIGQAEAFKYIIERIRMEKWHTSGIICWNAINGWPQFYNSVISYVFSRKLAYHYIKRSQKPIMLGMFGPYEWCCHLIICSDTLTDKTVTYKVWDADTKEALCSGEATADKNTSVPLMRIMSESNICYFVVNSLTSTLLHRIMANNIFDVVNFAVYYKGMNFRFIHIWSLRRFILYKY